MKPFSAELKIAFAVVTLLLGWLLAIMIPQNVTTGRDWGVYGNWLTTSPSAKWYLDGQGTLVGHIPKAEEETEFARQIQDKEIAELQLKSSDQIAARSGSRYAVFDPKTKTVVGDSTSVARSEPEKGMPEGKRSDKLEGSLAEAAKGDVAAVDLSSPGEVTQWELKGSGGQEEEDQKWAHEVETSIPVPPKFKEFPMPHWNDKVATAPPIGNKDILPRAKPESLAGPNVDKRKSTSAVDLAQVAKANKANSPVASGKAKSPADVVVKNGEKLVDSSAGTAFTPSASETPGKGTAPIVSSKPGEVPIVQPLASAKSKAPEAQTLTKPVDTGRPQVALSSRASGRLVVDPGASGKAWVAPQTSPPVSATLIRTDIPVGTPSVAPAHYSTTISKTVGRFPSEVRFGEVGEERLRKPASLRKTASRPSGNASTRSGIALPSSVRPVRLLSVITPEEFAKSRNMDRIQYTRFYEQNKHKLDSSGSFPAQTLLFVPD